MRFMVLVPGTRNYEKGEMPTEQELAAMGKFNEELAKAGVLLAGEGLHPTSKGARVTFGKGKPVVTDGPFTETKEVLGGFWLIRAKSRQEALEWMTRAPFAGGTTLEIRQVFDPEDFAASDPTGELRRKEDELRKSVQSRG